jgi:putative ABC transport system permease protein
MSTSVLQPPAAKRAANGGAPARRAIARWAWRLFRREWRQQVLVLTLLILAIAATTVGLGLVTQTVAARSRATLGTANTRVTIAQPGGNLEADIAAARDVFGAVDVIEIQKVAIPGSVSTIELRAQDPHGPYGHVMLRLDAGRYPAGANEVAVTSRVGRIFNQHIGDTWRVDGRSLHVVGLVENPGDLQDSFALVAANQVTSPSSLSLLVNADQQTLQSFHPPGANGVDIERRSASETLSAETTVLGMATIALLFVGLLAAGGFAVLAGRRQRALGMLGSLGATDRHVRLVMLANGAVVGVVGALLGAALGLAFWLAFTPAMGNLLGHRFDRFDLPWSTIGLALILAVLSAVGAAWWPAQTCARVSIVTAISGRPPRPQPARRFATLAGALLVAGPGLLVLSDQRAPALIVTGIIATALGVLLLAPLTIQALARVAGRSPIGIRLALRDLARYQARSGAALAAITLAIGIAATIAINAAVSEAKTDAVTGGNLPNNEIVVYLSADHGGPVPQLTPAQVQAAQRRVSATAALVGTHDILELDQAFNPTSPDRTDPISGVTGKSAAAMARGHAVGGGFEFSLSAPLYVATPALLSHYGIKPDQVDPTADILSSRSDLAGQTLLIEGAKGPRGGIPPKIQHLPLPRYSSDPNTLITSYAMHRFDLHSAPVAWLIHAPQRLTSAQVDAASKLASRDGLTIETRPTQQSLTELRNDATAVGILVALGVLAMTVGLIRSETAGDLRTLTATGASRTTRRTLTGATAGALAMLGGLLGTAGAYLALIAWYHRNLHPFTHVPVLDILALVLILPLVALIAGWLFAGREPTAMARQPLE